MFWQFYAVKEIIFENAIGSLIMMAALIISIIKLWRRQIHWCIFLSS